MAFEQGEGLGGTGVYAEEQGVVEDGGLEEGALGKAQLQVEE